jgi:hypothetical protein
MLRAILMIVGQRAFNAGYAGHARLLHCALGGNLVAHQADGLCARADEHEAALFDALGKIRVLRQEAVAGMDGLCIGHLRGADDGGDVQVAQVRWRRADAYRLVGQLDVFGIGIGLGVHNDGLDTQFAAGALDAESNLPAICDQYLFKHQDAPNFGCGAQPRQRGRN